MTDSDLSEIRERVAQMETEFRGLREFFGEKMSQLQKQIEQLALGQRPRGVNWTAIGVSIGAIGMVCSFAWVWMKVNMQPLEMGVAANTKQIEAVAESCKREHQWNWDGMKQRVDTVKKDQERQEALIRLLMADKLGVYDKSTN